MSMTFHTCGVTKLPHNFFLPQLEYLIMNSVAFECKYLLFLGYKVVVCVATSIESLQTFIARLSPTVTQTILCCRCSS